MLLIKVAFEKEPYKVINCKFSGESQIFQLLALNSFHFFFILFRKKEIIMHLYLSYHGNSMT